MQTAGRKRIAWDRHKTLILTCPSRKLRTLCYKENTFIILCHPMLEKEHMRQISAGIKKVLTAYRK